MANIFGNMAKAENQMSELIPFIIFGFIFAMITLAMFRVNLIAGLIISAFCMGFWLVFICVIREYLWS